MKTNNEQEQMIKEEFEKDWKIHLSELRTKGFSDKFIEMENSGKWLPQAWFIKGQLRSMEEIDGLKLSLLMLNSSLQEKEQEIERLNKKVTEFADACNAWNDRYLELESELRIAEMERVPAELYEELKSKLPDQEELGEVIERVTMLGIECIGYVDPLHTGIKAHYSSEFKTIKAFLESLGEK